MGYVRGEYDFRRIGIEAAARRYANGSGSRARSGEASWFTSYGTRKAYIEEVSRRMDALWKDIYQSHAADEAFRVEFNAFMQSWQQWVGSLSYGAMMLPSTEEHAQRVNQQIEEWRRRFAALGGTASMPGYQAPGGAPAPSFPWGKLFLAVAIVGVVAGVAVVAGKLPDVPGPRYS